MEIIRNEAIICNINEKFHGRDIFLEPTKKKDIRVAWKHLARLRVILESCQCNDFYNFNQQSGWLVLLNQLDVDFIRDFTQAKRSINHYLH